MRTSTTFSARRTSKERESHRFEPYWTNSTIRVWAHTTLKSRKHVGTSQSQCLDARIVVQSWHRFSYSCGSNMTIAIFLSSSEPASWNIQVGQISNLDIFFYFSLNAWYHWDITQSKHAQIIQLGYFGCLNGAKKRRPSLSISGTNRNILEQSWSCVGVIPWYNYIVK